MKYIDSYVERTNDVQTSTSEQTQIISSQVWSQIWVNSFTM